MKYACTKFGAKMFACARDTASYYAYGESGAFLRREC